MKRLFIRLIIVAVLATSVGIASAYFVLMKSLPQLDGELVTDGLAANVVIDRDASGIPTVTAANREDLAYATGYVHGQDRFFQMDLTRRKAAGELAEIFGSVALPIDRRSRFHRFRTRAGQVLGRMSTTEEMILQAYTDGVNDGLSGLGVKPFEYFLLNTKPRPWEQADTLLVVYSMFMELNDETAQRDVGRGLAQNVLPKAAFHWLYPEGTTWDAPLIGEPRSEIDLPDPQEFSLHGLSAAKHAAGNWPERLIPGSNNWAVSGLLTTTGAAIVANDMHLGLTAPNVFYRARLRVQGDTSIDLNGLTLPGTPILVAGSNGRVAWGNTNSYGDWTDAVIVRPGDAAETYLTPGGQKAFTTFREVILVKDQDPETLEIRDTIWGPLREERADPDQLIAVSWIAHHADAVTLGHLDLENAQDAQTAMAIANNIGMPPQNFVVGDVDGNIGWTIAGRIPRRIGSTVPVDWSETGGWNGWLAAAEYPRVLNPESGRIWTANARVADSDALLLIGDGGYDLGARARQIRDSLTAIDQFAPEDMLAIQLDDRALFLDRWHDLLLDTLGPSVIAGNEGRASFRRLVEDWIPRATPESVGYRLVREFRNEVRRRVIAMFFQPVIERYGPENLEVSNQLEGPIWALLTQKPAYLLTDNYVDWSDLLVQAVDANIRGYAETYPDGLENRTWGERNTAAIQHPLSRAVPFFSRWIDMPADELRGDSNMPRAQFPDFGASERFGVSPGHEESGYLHMPAGQSGHPLSDYYFKGHNDWVEGRPTGFLPGPTVHSLTLNSGN